MGIINKRSSIDSEFHRRHGWGGLRKLTMMVEGKGGASISYNDGAEQRKIERVKLEVLHTFKQPYLMRTHFLSQERQRGSPPCD